MSEYRNSKENDLCYGCKFAVEETRRNPWSGWYRCKNLRRLTSQVDSVKAMLMVGRLERALEFLSEAVEKKKALEAYGSFETDGSAVLCLDKEEA